MQLTPPIYATGVYTVASPFELVAGADYTCHAIRTFDDCYLRDLDVYTLVYAKHDIARSKYLDDEKAGINLITLMSEGNPTVYIPDSYITSYPNMGEAIPQRLIVSVDLGIISSHWNEQYLLTQMENLASDVIGGNPTARLHSTPITGRASAEDVKALDAIRNVSVANRISDYAKAQGLEKQNDLLNDKVKSLENKIRDM